MASEQCTEPQMRLDCNRIRLLQRQGIESFTKIEFAEIGFAEIEFTKIAEDGFCTCRGSYCEMRMKRSGTTANSCLLCLQETAFFTV